MTEFAGRVAQLQRSTEATPWGQGGSMSLQVWDFEIQHVDDAGDVDRVVSVHIVGRSFDGNILNDEDVRIELPARWRENETAQVDRIWSETRKVWVKAYDVPHRRPRAVVIGTAIVILVSIASALTWVSLRVGSVPGPPLPSGPTAATVPNVVGFETLHAVEALDKAGFDSSEEDEQSSTVPWGKVIRTDPAPGALARRGDTVTMYVSLGPGTGSGAGTGSGSGTGTESAIVPNVVGWESSRAIDVLVKAGFSVSTEQLDDSSVPWDHVIRTDPTPGSSARKGATVTIYVSIHPSTGP